MEEGLGIHQRRSFRRNWPAQYVDKRRSGEVAGVNEGERPVRVAVEVRANVPFGLMCFGSGHANASSGKAKV